MKKWVVFLGLLVAWIVGIQYGAYAENNQAEDAHPGRHEDMDDGMMGGGMMGDRLDRLKEKLGLTDDQAVKLKGLFKKQMEDTRSLRDQMRIDMDTLRQKVDMKTSDSEIKKLLDALSADRDKIEEGRRKMEKNLREILTPTQQAKFLMGMRARGMEMMHRWKGMKGRPNKKAEGKGGHSHGDSNHEGNSDDGGDGKGM